MAIATGCDLALINVLKTFTIRLIRDGHDFERRVEAGVQEVEDFIAEHWYAKAHTSPLPEGVTAAPVKAEMKAASQNVGSADAVPAASAKTAVKVANK